MKPASSEPAELLNRVRQQLILAQVRIMELEDVRDELAPRLAETDRLLRAAQELADAKADEAAHLEKVRADLQAQFEHMRHMQHVTNEALDTTRGQLATAGQSIERLRQEAIGLLTQTAHLSEQTGRLQQELSETRATAATRLARIEELDAAQRAMKASRSWRWTAWLRSLERLLRQGRP